MNTLSIDNYINLELTITQILTALERKCHPKWSYEEKGGRFYHGLVYVLGGKAYYTMENESFSVETGNLVFLEKGSCYFSKSDPDDPYHFISVSFEISNDALLRTVFRNNVFIPTNPQKCSGLFQDISRLWFYKGIAYKVKCIAILTEIIYDIIQQSIQENMHHRNFSGIQPAVSYIETYFYKNITLVELAEMSRLSIPHFRRVFKEIYKVPPIKYLNFVRINKAKDMIMSRMYSISEIAEKTGYPNVYYFSRVFKKLTGSSPKAYEKMGG